MIKACGENGVKSLKYMGLEIQLGETTHQEYRKLDFPKLDRLELPVELPTEMVDNSIELDHEELSRNLDDYIEELKITDPLQYERTLMNDGDLDA